MDFRTGKNLTARYRQARSDHQLADIPLHRRRCSRAIPVSRVGEILQCIIGAIAGKLQPVKALSDPKQARRPGLN